MMGPHFFLPLLLLFFCSAGLVFSYLIFQLTLFLLFHTIIAITGPFTFRTLKLSGHMRYIHIASIVLAFLLPLVPSLVPVKDGYIPAGFPAYICWSRNLDLLYYFQILPFSVISTVVSSLQLLLVWIILKVHRGECKTSKQLTSTAGSINCHGNCMLRSGDHGGNNSRASIALSQYKLTFQTACSAWPSSG